MLSSGRGRGGSGSGSDGSGGTPAVLLVHFLLFVDRKEAQPTHYPNPHPHPHAHPHPNPHPTHTLPLALPPNQAQPTHQNMLPLLANASFGSTSADAMRRANTMRPPSLLPYIPLPRLTPPYTSLLHPLGAPSAHSSSHTTPSGAATLATLATLATAGAATLATVCACRRAWASWRRQPAW